MSRKALKIIKPWTIIEEQELTQLRDEGYRVKDIAQMLGRGVDSVYDKIYNLRNISPLKLKNINAVPRDCLKCHKSFRSSGPGNRICNTCSKTNATQCDIQYAVGR